MTLERRPSQTSITDVGFKKCGMSCGVSDGHLILHNTNLVFSYLHICELFNLPGVYHLSGSTVSSLIEMAKIAWFLVYNPSVSDRLLPMKSRIPGLLVINREWIILS